MENKASSTDRNQTSIIWILFIVILIIGVLVRIWEFGKLPPGLNKDETSIGVEAYDLLHFGMDRNGVSFPVHFISWGSGQNALYAYLLIPFIYFWGLSSVTVRLPMLILGILSLPLIYLLGKYTFGVKNGLLLMFFLAISPWHIMISRWGLESNIFPFFFLVGFVCLLLTSKNSVWFIPACLSFGLSLYCYGTAYFVVPVFLIVEVFLLTVRKRIKLKYLISGLILFAAIATPIFIFILINSLNLATIHLGPITMPRLPSRPRYESITSITSVFNLPEFFHSAYNHAIILFKLLILQTDRENRNVVEPFGYFYSFTFPLAVLGAFFMFSLARKLNKIIEIQLILLWLIVSVLMGLLLNVEINQMNIIFLPLIFCTAAFFTFLAEHSPINIKAVVSVFLIGFGLFVGSYFGKNYRQQINPKFFVGIIPAVQYASGISPDTSHICISDRINMAYVFVLFSEKINPSEYLKSIQYDDPTAEFRTVKSMGRYTFSIADCPGGARTIYIFESDEAIPLGENYSKTRFDDYLVYVPK